MTFIITVLMVKNDARDKYGLYGVASISWDFSIRMS